MRQFIAAVASFVVRTILLPVTLLGYGIWIGSLIVNRGSGVSATAQGPLSARWFQHNVGTRRDDTSNRLMEALPGVARLGPRLVISPLRLAHRLTGVVPGAFRYPFKGVVSLRNQAAARQTFYDAVVDRYITNVAQLVVLGAGFDTRTFRVPIESNVRAFEVDMPTTIRTKQETLRTAGVDASHVTFVPANMQNEDWFAHLKAAGFDPHRATIFLWEGVTPYLDRAAVERTLFTIGHTANGSVLAFDFFTTEVLVSKSLQLRMLRRLLRAGGEPLKFGIDNTPPLRDRVTALLQPAGLTLIECRVVGQEVGGKGALGGFASAAVR
jgi:methyltransferase (TIGR00027 family)